MSEGGAQSHAERQMQFLYHLRSRGVRDKRTLEAMERIDRGAFVRGTFSDRAYEDTPLPISCGQTISQPSVVGLMTQALEVEPRHKVLEIGTGSGYQAAVLSHLCDRVFTIERYRELQAGASKRLRSLDIHNVTTIIGDGWLGWPPGAPYDRIIVTAAASEPPAALLEQLRVGGRLVMPVGPTRDEQTLVEIDKQEDGETRTELLAVRFVPLVKGRVKRNRGSGTNGAPAS